MPKELRRLLSPTISVLLVCGLASASYADADTGTTPAAALEVAPPPVDPNAPPVVVDPGTGEVKAPPGSAIGEAQADPAGTMDMIVRDVRDGGTYRYAAGGMLVLLMALGIRFQLRLFGKTKRGRALALMCFATGGAIGAALFTTVPINPGLFAGALGVAFTAAGGRTWVAALLWPDDGAEPWLDFLRPWFGK